MTAAVQFQQELPNLQRIAVAEQARYRQAQPFPHVVIDGFLPEQLARATLDAFPLPGDDVGWDRYAAAGFEMKLASSDRQKLPVAIVGLLDALNDEAFLHVLETLTGIGELMPDPQFLGGGVHLSGPGDHLGIHADFNWHESLQAHRRINLLLYFNEDWREHYQGNLELWATDASHRVLSIAPVFNRAVIFNTRSDTFHGHPAPLDIPERVYRRSIAMYYYSRERPSDELIAPHGTRYKGLHVD